MKKEFYKEIREKVKGTYVEETEYGYTGRMIFINDVNEEETYYFVIKTKNNETIQDTDRLIEAITITEFDKERNLLEPIESDLFIEQLTIEIQRGF